MFNLLKYKGKQREGKQRERKGKGSKGKGKGNRCHFRRPIHFGHPVLNGKPPGKPPFATRLTHDTSTWGVSFFLVFFPGIPEMAGVLSVSLQTNQTVSLVLSGDPRNGRLSLETNPRSNKKTSHPGTRKARRRRTAGAGRPSPSGSWARAAARSSGPDSPRSPRQIEASRDGGACQQGRFGRGRLGACQPGCRFGGGGGGG